MADTIPVNPVAQPVAAVTTAQPAQEQDIGTYQITSPKTGQTYTFQSAKEPSDTEIHSAMEDSDAAYVAEKMPNLRGGVGYTVPPGSAKALEQYRIAEREKLSGMPNPGMLIVNPDTATTRALSGIIGMFGGDPEKYRLQPGQQGVYDTTTLSPPVKALATTNRFVNSATLGTLGTLEKGLQSIGEKTGVVDPETIKQLGVKALNEKSGAEGIAADVLGNFATPLSSVKIIKGAGVVPALANSSILGGGMSGVNELNRELTEEGAVHPVDITSHTALGSLFGLGIGGLIKSPEIGGKIIQTGKNLVQRFQTNLAEGAAQKLNVTNLADNAAKMAEEANRIVAQQTSAPAVKTPGVTTVPETQPTAIDPKLPETIRESVTTGIANGLHPEDVQLLTNLTPQEQKIVQVMVNNAEEFGGNKLKKDMEPRLQVGEDLYGKVKAANKIKTEMGQQLGEFAKSIPRTAIVSSLAEKSTPEVQFINEGSGLAEPVKTPVQNAQQTVVDRMQAVPRLNGVTVDANGKLNFENTGFIAAAQEGDRKAIQQEFDQIAGKSPFRLHKLRQALFDPDSAEHTDTHDLAMDAIRKGLADVIEKVSPDYKALNQQYAKVAEPLASLKKDFFKGTEWKNENFFTAKAALMARRLANNTTSGIDLGDHIDALENGLSTNGIPVKTRTLALQLAHDVVERYNPEIVRGKSFKGEISGAMEGLGGGEPHTIFEATAGKLVKKGKEMTGKTPAVTKKALKDLVDALNMIPNPEPNP